MWSSKKIYASDDDVTEIVDIENLNSSPKVASGKKKDDQRIFDEAEIGNISRLGITGRRKRFPDRVKFSATHVVPAKIGTKLWFLKALKKLFPESSLIESDEIPYFHIAVICVAFYFVFIAVGIFFGYATYMDMRTSYFLSLGGNQSLPGTTMTVQECWEVPRTLTGQFYGDNRGFWNTRAFYNPSKTMFGATATILRITTAQWRIAMEAAVKKMKAVTARSVYRDLAWNLVMFSSFYVTVNGPIFEDSDNNKIPGGTLDFYVAADADILLGSRRIVSATFANQFHGICDPANIDSYFDNGDKSFVFQYKLCNVGFCELDHRNSDFKFEYISSCPNWYADVNTTSSNSVNDGSYYKSPRSAAGVSLNTVSFKSNAIFDPQQFGYRYGTMKHNYFELKVDSRSLTLALAVNYGILEINSLTKMTKTDKLKSYLTNLARQQVITIAQANTIHPFYDPKYAPMKPIYCMLFPGDGGGPAAVDMPNFNSGVFAGEDDAKILGSLYDDDTLKDDDDTAHIKFGGPNMNIYELPKSLFVSYQFTVQNYDISKIGTTSTTNIDIDSDKAAFTTAIEDALTTAFTAYNGPKDGLKGAVNLTTIKIWYFNNDPETFSGSQNFNPGLFSRRLDDRIDTAIDNEVEKDLKKNQRKYDALNRILTGSPPPPPPPPPASPTPAPAKAVTTVDTVITFGFKFNAEGSRSDNLYRALQDLSELIAKCDFITNLNDKIQATSPSFRDTLVANAGNSADMAIDPYSLILDTFFVKRRPDEEKSDDAVKVKPPRSDPLIGDDYFGDDAIPPDPKASRRRLDELDANIKLSDYKMRIRDRILQVVSEPNGNIFRRKLKPVEPPIPIINKNTGATCFVMSDDTFMYPIMSHYGQDGTTRCECMKNNGAGTWAKDDDCYAAAVLGKNNNPDNYNTSDPDNNAGKYYYKTCYRGTNPPPLTGGAQFRIDHHDAFPFLPKICDEKDGHKDACENFDINVGLVFYPGIVDPRDNKLKPNGQIFSFGENVYKQIIDSPEKGDLDVINSAYDAMSMIAAAAADYRDLRPDGVPGNSSCRDYSSGTVHSTNCYGRKYIKKYSLDRWNKAFQQVCGSTGCSMFNFRLRDKLKTPSMNIYDFRPKESPSYRNILVDEAVLEKLIDNVPTQFIEIFYQCVSTISNAWMTSIGVGNSNADFFASVSFTTLIILTIFHMRYRKRRRKNIHFSQEQEKELDDAAEKYRDQMMIDAIELLVSKEKARCGSDDPDFQSMEKALDAIYKIDDKEYDVFWEYEDEHLNEVEDEADKHE